MNRRLFLLLLALVIPAGSRSADPVNDSPAGTPAKNWELPLFTKEGPRSMTLRGSEVRLVGTNRYDVVDFNVIIFSGKSDAHVDGILLSPSATFLDDNRNYRASGNKSVRLIRDDMEITGEQWTYLHALKKVTIQKNSRVVFHTPLPDLIQ